MFEEVEKIRPEIEGVEANLAAARTRLMTEIRGADRRTRTSAPRRRWLIPASAVGVLVAATAGVLVVQNLTRPAPTVDAVPTGAPVATSAPTPTSPPAATPVPSPMSAADVFRGAAAAARAATVPGPGQYLRISGAHRQLVAQNQQDGVNDLAVTRKNADRAWILDYTTTTYVPSDLSADWVIDGTGGGTAIGESFGDGAAEAGQEWLDTASIMTGGLERVPGGSSPWWAGTWAMTAQDRSFAGLLADLPRDPDALIEWLNARVDDPAKSGWILARILGQNAGAPELRATMYDAFAKLPGAEISQIDADHATVLLRTTDPGSGETVWWRTITIDRHSGLVTRYTERQGSNPALVPDAVADDTVDYTFSVVDSAP